MSTKKLQIVTPIVTSVNGQTGDVTLDIPSKVSDLTNDNFVQYTAQTLTDEQKTQARENIKAMDIYNGLTPVECTYTYPFSGTKTIYIEKGTITPPDSSASNAVKAAYFNIVSGAVSTVHFEAPVNVKDWVKYAATAHTNGVIGDEFIAYENINKENGVSIKYTTASDATKNQITYKLIRKTSFKSCTVTYYPNTDTFSEYAEFFSFLTTGTSKLEESPTLSQVEMSAAPTTDMQIATKKYVDDVDAKLDNYLTHPMILNEKDYGTTLPENPTNGQLFFQETTATSLLDLVYPVGAVYISMNQTSPATLFGGTWVQIQGRFLLGADTSYPSGSTGGEAEHILTTDEIPAHKHVQKEYVGGYSGWSTQNWPFSSYGYIWSKDHALNTTSANFTSAGIAANNGDTLTTGGGQAHNNMPPYFAVYMWYRES